MATFIAGCHFKQESNKIVSINGKSVTYNEIDHTIKNKLYDELYKIYVYRKIALDVYVEDILLEGESKKEKISKDEFIENYLNINYSEIKLGKFIEENNLQLVPDIKRNLRYFNVNSPEGKEIVKKYYLEYLIDQLIDSLKKVSNIKIYLTPPISPFIADNFKFIHYRGNSNSPITFIEVSDPECDNCRKNADLYNYFFEKYKEKVKFGFVSFSSYANLYAVALECESSKEAFWEFKDLLYKSETLLDTTDVLRIAGDLGINKLQLEKEIKEGFVNNKLEENFKTISSFGIYATPTIIINNKAVYDPSSIEEIESLLNEELEK